MKGEIEMNTDFNAKTRVIYTDSKNSKFSHDDKIKLLEDAIQNGGYYGDDGTWNSITVFSGDKHVYRVRVETLIIKDNNFIFLKFLPKDQKYHKKCNYLVPGGSIAKDISNIDQAVNECKEEARIIVKNIQSVSDLQFSQFNLKESIKKVNQEKLNSQYVGFH